MAMNDGSMSERELKAALNELSTRMAGSSVFTPNVLPLRLICLGGFVSVAHFHSRETTQDIDFYWPGIFQGGVYTIPDRIDAKLEDLIEDPDEEHVLKRSFEQGVVLYSSPQIMLFAASWTFQLVLKLTAISTRVQPSDIDDAAYIGQHLLHGLGRPIRTSELRAEFSNRMEAVKDTSIARANAKAQQLFGHHIIDIVT
ncbi:hypothetical protein B0H11DRAFT_2261866 [Mycena galericulata]|nr:hypothetical protein B0H11DRAFT_2261866 [Mycena galericulata]